jgi:hypothetical protein
MRTNHNRVLSFCVLSLFLVALLATNIPPAAALRVLNQETDPAGDVFTFGQLGSSEIVMFGPIGTGQILFGVPSNWQLTPGTEVTLRFNYASNRVVSTVDGVVGLPGVTLRFFFNGVPLRTIFLTESGNVEVTIPIPSEAFTADSVDGRHRISFLFDSRFDCIETTTSATLIISADSSINLKHEIVPITPDLTIFPRPIYQADSIIPSVATIVIPDNPSEAEMRAALSVSAGLGALTNGELQYNMVPVGQFSEASKADTGVILIGLPENLAVLQDISLPYPSQNGAWVVAGMEPDDGLVQTAVSPWNQGNVALVVSGNSEAGLLKAAQAVSAGNLVPTGRPDVSVISAVNPSTISDIIPQDQTLFSLGYENRSIGGFEGTYTSYFFPASAEQVLSIGGYVDVVLSQTDLLDLNRSGITIYLNRNFLGSIRFTDDVDQVTTTRLNILPGTIRRGNNLLEIYGDLIPIYDCFSLNLSSNTVVISGLTNIHLPIAGQQLNLNAFLNLNDYPAMFTSDRNLGELAFIVARNDPIGWDTASKLAFNIGATASIPIATLDAAFGDSVPQTLRDEYSLILVGRASNLPIISELNESLPAPFDLDSDEAIQPALLVNYRLLPGVSVGYLQLTQSPWNADNAILVVAGNTDAGVPMAGEKLIRPEFGAQLNGNLSLLYNDQVLTADTRFGQSRESLVSSLPAEVLATPAQPQPVPGVSVGDVEIEARPSWILPAMIVLGVATVLMLLVLVLQAWARRLPAKKKADHQV